VDDEGNIGRKAFEKAKGMKKSRQLSICSKSCSKRYRSGWNR